MKLKQFLDSVSYDFEEEIEYELGTLRRANYKSFMINFTEQGVVRMFTNDFPPLDLVGENEEIPRLLENIIMMFIQRHKIELKKKIRARMARHVNVRLEPIILNFSLGSVVVEN